MNNSTPHGTPHLMQHGSPDLVYVKKANGVLEPFDQEKLVGSLDRAGVDKKTINEIVGHVLSELQNGITTGEIYAHAFEMLNRNSRVHAITYSLRRALSELGPNGFPFEKFISEILKEKGYNVLTDQIVQGRCVAHEMDVVAWNDKELIMIEAKFHNEFGLKSDVKVALYVKARFDDLKTVTFNYGGKDRQLTDGWLVTNTKFTEQAIAYGACTGLTMIGWNYPLKGNLLHLIEDSRLHPFTCLATLTTNHKKKLLDLGVILCRDISRNPKILNEIGLSADEIKNVMAEIDNVCVA